MAFWHGNAVSHSHVVPTWLWDFGLTILTTLLQLGYSVEWMVLIRFFIPNGFAIWNAPGILPGGAADAARKDVQFQSLQTIRFAATALLWQLLLNTFNSNLEIGIHSADFGVP